MTQSNPKKIVFVLGSGFSKSLVNEMPLIHGFFLLKYQLYAWRWMLSDKTRGTYIPDLIHKFLEKAPVDTEINSYLEQILRLLEEKNTKETRDAIVPGPFIQWTKEEVEEINKIENFPKLQEWVFNQRYPGLFGFLQSNHHLFKPISPKDKKTPPLPPLLNGPALKLIVSKWEPFYIRINLLEVRLMVSVNHN